MLTNIQLVEYCKEVYARKWVYWYGTCGYKCDLDLYKSKKKQYPKYYTPERESGYMADIKAGAMCCDCVGMIKSFFWKGGDIDAETRYDGDGKRTGCPDQSANGMFELCRDAGFIGTIPEVPGLVVWRNGHIGVYIGGGYTIEARGFAYDIQKRKLTDGTWTKWGRLPFMEYDATASEPTAEKPIYKLGDRLLKYGARGADVKELQIYLAELGFDIGRTGADGVFGALTEKAVRELQKAAEIDVDGIVGKDTLRALMAALARSGSTEGEAKNNGEDGGETFDEELFEEPSYAGDAPGDGEHGIASENYYNATVYGVTLPQLKEIAEMYGVRYKLEAVV